MSFANIFTLADLVEIDMLDFYVILGMDWIHSRFVSINYRTRVVKFQFQNEPIVEWKGENLAPKSQIIACLKSCNFIVKGCRYHIVRVKYLQFVLLHFESVPVVKEYSEVFSDDLPEIHPKQEIDINIYLL